MLINIMNENKNNSKLDFENYKEENVKSKKSSLPGFIFLGGVTGISLLCGFSYTLMSVKKSDPTMFDKGVLPEVVSNQQSGISLALRALRRATFYSVGGFTLFLGGIWLLSGAKNFEEFKSTIPKAHKNKPMGRQEFESLQELVDYIVNDEKE